MTSPWGIVKSWVMAHLLCELNRGGGCWADQNMCHILRPGVANVQPKHDYRAVLKTPKKSKYYRYLNKNIIGRYKQLFLILAAPPILSIIFAAASAPAPALLLPLHRLSCSCLYSDAWPTQILFKLCFCPILLLPLKKDFMSTKNLDGDYKKVGLLYVTKFS